MPVFQYIATIGRHNFMIIIKLYKSFFSTFDLEIKK